MENVYIEKLIEKSQAREKLNGGERTLIDAYHSSNREGFDILVCREVIWESDVEDFVSALRAAQVNELYITTQASNMLDVYLMFDGLGLKLRGVAKVENPEYKAEMEHWGQSWKRPFLPAMKLNFEG